MSRSDHEDARAPRAMTPREFTVTMKLPVGRSRMQILDLLPDAGFFLRHRSLRQTQG